MKLGLTRRLEKALKEAGIPYTIYDKTVANPTTVNVREALELYHKEGCDAIIGFGGGSSMDLPMPFCCRWYFGNMAPALTKSSTDLPLQQNLQTKIRRTMKQQSFLSGQLKR